MKNVKTGFVIVFLAALVVFLTSGVPSFLFDKAGDLFYSYSYDLELKKMYLPSDWSLSRLASKFKKNGYGGMSDGEGTMDFSYSSFYEKDKKYGDKIHWYLLRNNGSKKAYARSKLFRKIFGHIRIELEPSQVILASIRGPETDGYKGEMLWVSYHSRFSQDFGTTIDLIVPK